MQTIHNIDFKGKKVLIRVDFNVPLNHNRQIADKTRIKESIGTIKMCLEKGAAVILMSHLGRPKGGFELDYSLTPIVPVLSKMLNQKIIFNRELFGDNTKTICKSLQPGEVVLLENMRFYSEEEEADEKFASELASLADIYINDAFATAHRAHCSTFMVPKYFSGNKYCGLLMEKELENLNKILNAEIHPFTAIVGGGKVSTKIDILKNLISKVDNLIIGGGMAFTFVKALGGKIGDSLVEEDRIDFVREIVTQAMLNGVNLYLPVDVIIADSFSEDAETKITKVDAIDDGWMGLDIGPRSRKRFAEIIQKSGKILWNGPMGVFEMEKFKIGTKAIAVSVASATISGSFTLIGGGDSVAATNRFNLADMFSYVSTAGGAMLEYIQGKELPSIKALED